MSRRNRGTIPETEAERALADYARSRFSDYMQRWLPVQVAAADQIRGMREPGSFERRQMQAMFGAETGRAFDEAARKAEASEWAGGINPGSARSRMRAAGMALDRAAASGIGWSRANQIIEDAYVRGLSALAAAGRGQSASVGDALGSAAGLAQQHAAGQAAASAADRAAMYELAGTGIGFAGRAMSGRRRGVQPGPSNVFEWGYPEG